MEQAYLDLLKDILDNGEREPNRTGIDTLTLPGAMLKFDLREGFPAVTTKKLAWKAVVGELIGFLRGSRSLAEFKALGCNVWDQNVNAPSWQNSEHCQGPDDMGRIYGTQWRDWPSVAYEIVDDELIMERRSIDQIAVALAQVRHSPQSRRIKVNGWNPAEVEQACLPPCHTDFQIMPRSDGTLHMAMNMRSVDMFLGCPFNIASYALLLELFALWSGRKAATLTMFLADAHIYVNHIDQVIEQLNRPVYPAPRLWLEHKAPPEHIAQLPIDVLVASLDPAKIHLLDYQHHAAIKAPMAV